MAVLADGEVQDGAAGALSLRTRVETTTDSLFKVGSITKLWTATLVQQLVDEGALDLDRTVRDHIPGFRLKDPVATGSLTARHLPTRTGGIGNHLIDTGRDEDAIEDFVAALADADQLLPPDTVFSYSDAPTGSHLAMSARDLLEFVRPHLTDPALAALREPRSSPSRTSAAASSAGGSAGCPTRTASSATPASPTGRRLSCPSPHRRASR